MADVDVECHTPHHRNIQMLAWLVVLVYPVGLLLTTAVLLRMIKHHVQGDSPPSRLSAALSFLYSNFRPDMYQVAAFACSAQRHIGVPSRCMQRVCTRTGNDNSPFRMLFLQWELAEMTRRFLLVGIAVVVEPGTILQLTAATLFSLVFLVMQHQVISHASAE